MTGEIELQPDGSVKSVAVIYTDLELSSLHPAYDANAVEELIGRIQAYQKDNHQPIRLRTVQSRGAPSFSVTNLLPKNPGRHPSSAANGRRLDRGGRRNLAPA